jgi:hypothetical protein
MGRTASRFRPCVTGPLLLLAAIGQQERAGPDANQAQNPGFGDGVIRVLCESRQGGSTEYCNAEQDTHGNLQMFKFCGGKSEQIRQYSILRKAYPIPESISI